MNIDLSRLNNNIDKRIKIDDTIVYSNLEGTDIISIEPVYVKGHINKNSLNNYEIHVTVSGRMYLPCSITLKEVPYDFSIKIDKNLDEFIENNEKSQNILDISPLIWENILVEVPMKVVSSDISDATLEGDGWKFVTNGVSGEVVNPELEKLNDLL